MRFVYIQLRLYEKYKLFCCFWKPSIQREDGSK